MGVKLLFFTIFIGAFFLGVPLVSGVEAASLQFDPATVSATVGQPFDMKINATLGTDPVTSVDVYVLYDPALVEVVSAVKGTLFPTVSQSLAQSGKAYISGLVDDPATAKTGNGTVATITFKAKTNGTATLKFDCTQGSTTDSNINKNDAGSTDLIQCSSNGQSVVTIGGGTVATATPIPSTLPNTGTLTNIGAYGMMGALLLFVGFGARFLL